MIESGSFRDPTARVFYQDDRVLRGLAGEAAEIDAAARSTGLMDQLVEKGLFVKNWVVDDVKPPAGIPDQAVIESTRLAVMSYPSEWSFSMLRDAALLTLDANLLCLEKGFILKDASAFNIVFDGVAPTIIDIASIDKFGERGIWTAYGQFCDHFLAPIMLEAYAGIPFQRMLHGKTDGVPIGDLNRLLRGRAGIHKGILTHVRLRSMLERRAAGMATAERRDVGKASLPASAVAGTMKKLRDLIADLESAAPSTWGDYEEALPYEIEATDAKAEFVREAAAAASSHDLAVDVGANAGLFTRILSEQFTRVIGIDNDQGAIDALYDSTKEAKLDNLTPLVVDITNPTPAFGWRGKERAAFTDRVHPTFSAWLAVLHHLCLGIGIPLTEVVAQIFEFSEEAVVEFVDLADPMAQRISASRTSDLAPYTRDLFEETAMAHGEILTKVEVSDTRTMYHVRSR
ncbi:MAG: hypothetical protein GY926_15345 [bacterium]|nr:hypothetical protein [bacterium]